MKIHIKEAIHRCFLLGLPLMYLGNRIEVHAQMPDKPNLAEVYQKIQKLNVLGNVLHIAAHPDDENTAFIAYMANEKLYKTGYLSLTRGDGGQNLIGPEIRERLGLIRTHELLQARNVDGGQQFFSRANDFGFSKNPEEVFRIWDREQILADVVWVVRNFRPDIIVTRFPKDKRAGHGQHSASSILAEEAFDAAADPNRFPEQLQYVAPWQAKRIVWNVSAWGFEDKQQFDSYVKGYVHMDIGGYNALLGKSYGEISAESRSMHKSQGFGSQGSRGPILEYFEHTKGPKATNDLFEDINTSWDRVPGSDQVSKSIASIIQNFDQQHPQQSVPALISLRKSLSKLTDTYWNTAKLEEVEELIKMLTGIFVEAIAKEERAVGGEELMVRTEIINRSDIPMLLKSVRFDKTDKESTINKPLLKGQEHIETWKIKIPETTALTQPYWLRTKPGLGMFLVNDQHQIGLPITPPALTLSYDVEIMGERFQFKDHVQYKRVDPVRGELYSEFVASPPITVNILDNVYVYGDEKPKQVKVRVKSFKPNTQGLVRLKLPSGWKAEPQEIPINIDQTEGEQVVGFTVYPPSEQSEGEIEAIAVVNSHPYNRGLSTITYDHIPLINDFPEAKAKAVKIDLARNDEKIGYIMGAGDDVPESLQRIGYDVSLLETKDITSENLGQYDVIILGVRSFNTNQEIKFYRKYLMDFVESGGNLIVQYNVDRLLKTTELGPYPFTLSRDRITEEDAAVHFLDSAALVLNKPNKITVADFDGWVQERGLYFPTEWDEHYEAVISSHDTGEKPLEGGILIAKYGKGNYVYTPLSWFRELPAGVPGAYRIFVNLISLGRP